MSEHIGDAMKPTREECAQVLMREAIEYAEGACLKYIGEEGEEITTEQQASLDYHAALVAAAAYLREPGAQELAVALRAVMQEAERRAGGRLGLRLALQLDKASALLARRDAREGRTHGEG